MKRNSKIRISQTKTHAPFQCAGQVKTETKNNPPALKSYGRAGLSNTFYRAVCILALFLLAIVFVPSGNQPVYADSQVDSLTAQISALTVQLNTKRAEAKTFADEVAIYDGEIHKIQLQIQATQAQIDVANSQITNINGKIVENESKLTEQKESLKEYIKVLYEESNTSTLELIASSNSFSDFVDRSEYLQTMQLRAKQIIADIKQLKQQLEDSRNNIEARKKEIASLQQTQLNQKAGLDNQRYSKQLLLSQANQQGNSIQNVIAQKETEKKTVQNILNNPPQPPPVAPPPVTTPPPDGGTPPTQSPVPYFAQDSGWWSGYDNNGKINDSRRPAGQTPSYMRELGCKITSLAMIMKYYGRGVDPGTIAHDSRYFSVWYSWDLLAWSGVQSASGLYINKGYSYAKGNQWASIGKPFIASGPIYGGGYDHSVVITGKTADGRWIMNDPISSTGPGRIFPLSAGQITDYVFVN